MDVCRGHKPWPTSQILQTPPMDDCPGSEVWCSRRAFLLGPSSTVGVSSTRQIDAISHGRIRAQYWNVLFLLIDTGNKNMIQIHIWVSWVWMRNMAGTGSKVHIQLTDMRKRRTWWSLGSPNAVRKKGHNDSKCFIYGVSLVRHQSHSATFLLHGHMGQDKNRNKSKVWHINTSVLVVSLSLLPTHSLW